ncbi:DUF6175 family protein [Flavilitoribacter nigricans]|uniref:Uncharacterized protein n=1 Tax=Flavilitoribacter nigricans (strain ATCC 23147 / DSM 23189 / NBRC 102662 / NCIMB 1420 / SS-2) TaxID=1122177 RepID=A0A2D0MY91_FLAN2|nr:DUF6175 family protein [Flavilitoribacter nigricans]PHN01234.1 hypothetical protein CRP01_38155 [Flavilitoribacter nigricans DSM 23189 = NBRC 102662]
MRYLLLLLLSSFFLPVETLAQGNGEVANIQPSIIVIPFAKEHEDLRTVLEEDIARRVAITKVKEGFDNRGYTTVDFRATLNILNTDATYTSGDLSDVKSAIVGASRADIYVEVEVDTIAGTGGANSARIILTAFDAFTGRSLANKTHSSPQSRGDFTMLVERALSSTDGDGERVELVEDFLNVMQEKFNDIVENGRTVKLLFTLDQNVAYDFDSESASGELIFDEIDFWLEENAYKGNYSDLRGSNLSLTIDEVRIPLKDERGRNYRPSRFARDIRLFLKGLNVPDNGGGLIADTDIRGGTIYVSLK